VRGGSYSSPTAAGRLEKRWEKRWFLLWEIITQ
jgi:hypothetical protein